MSPENPFIQGESVYFNPKTGRVEEKNSWEFEDEPTPQQTNPTPQQKKRAPQFGEKGYRKGKPNKRRGTPRARITEIDARLLAFLSQFPGGTAEDLTLINPRGENHFYGSEDLPRPETIQKRMNKLIKLGVVEKYRNPATGTTHYGATEKGWESARVYGYDLPTHKELEGMSIERLNHYQKVSMVAAEFTSPISYFKPTLGMNAAALEQLISETELRHHLTNTNQELREEAKTLNLKPRKFGEWREEHLKETARRLQAGEITASEITEISPAVFNIGYKNLTGQNLKNLHIPDLTLNLDINPETYEHDGREGKSGVRSKNIAVEIELSPKNYAEYLSLLQTYKAELQHGLIYDKIIYFTIGRQVENLMKRIDRQHEIGLFDTGKLIIQPLTNPKGEIEKPKNRIIIGA